MEESKVFRINGSRQLFVDSLLVEEIRGLNFKIHAPIPREKVLELNMPWEGCGSWGPTIIKDGDKFRMWYRALGDWSKDESVPEEEIVYFTAYAESDDGRNWNRPNLGLIEFEGSRDNNIVFDRSDMKNAGVFLDSKPSVDSNTRFKAVGALGSGARPSEIRGMSSPDGLRWNYVNDGEPLFVAEEPDWAFDSPVNAFYDTNSERYVIYTRGWYPDTPDNKIRAIRTATSKDFIHWSPWSFIKLINWSDSNWKQHLYTNSAHPYYRAPEYTFMFPKRLTVNRKYFKDWRYDGVSDVLFLASRDGIHFDNFANEVFLTPGLDTLNWYDRAMYIAPSLVNTGPGEMSFYAIQNHRTDKVHIRRFSMREDGIISLHASGKGGEFQTKPINFTGEQLEINFSTSAAGSIYVELLDINGHSIPGFGMDDGAVIFGDEIRRIVQWENHDSLKKWQGQPVRLRFKMMEADLFSFRFVSDPIDPEK